MYGGDQRVFGLGFSILRIWEGICVSCCGFCERLFYCWGLKFGLFFFLNWGGDMLDFRIEAGFGFGVI